MKNGLKVGNIAELGIVVDESMFASFGGKNVHQLYSTFSLVQHMEWVARKTILPFLEEKEEGMGCGLSVEHLQPAVAGSRIKLVAEVIALNKNRVECSVAAFGPVGKIACGSVSQIIVEKDWLKRKIDEVSAETRKINSTLFEKETLKGDEDGSKSDCAV